MKSKYLNAVISDLQEVSRRAELEPEQRKDLGRAIEWLKWLKRRPHPKRHEVDKCVRAVAGLLLKAFIK